MLGVAHVMRKRYVSFQPYIKYKVIGHIRLFTLH